MCDDIWGPYYDLVMAWSGEPHVRFQASTGGVLSAIGRYILSSGMAKFVLHAGVHPDDPLRTHWVISENPDDVLKNSGSRYGPVSILEGVKTALARNEPFLFIGKPCDCSALRRYMAVEPKAKENCIGLITMVCGGSSTLKKTQEAVATMGIDEKDIASFRYRGFGTPGPHRVTKKDGSYTDIDYNVMWARDQKGWRIQSRCKICADPIGENADIAASRYLAWG